MEENTAARTSKGRFIVLEGLSAVGKSSAAPLLAEQLSASQVGTQPPWLNDVRVQVDDMRLVMVRLHFWMMCHYLASERVRGLLASGRDVVLESYIYRTLATHAAMGAPCLPAIDWEHTVRPDLAVLLTVDEAVRQQRIAARGLTRGKSYWSRLAEANVEAMRHSYDTFGMTVLDTTGLEITEVVDRLARLNGETTTHGE
jgi:thymidylate kinase